MRSLLFAALLSTAALTTTASASVIPEVAAAQSSTHSGTAQLYASTPAQQRSRLAARRQLQIDRLQAYANAGVFPINDTRPGLLSQLLDGRGNPCAMAHLMTLDGRGALIQRLARTENSIELGDQRHGPVHDWILASGLTHAEVAYIQEPDFFTGMMADPRTEMTQLERVRLQSHFQMAAAHLQANFDRGLDDALVAAGAVGAPGV